MCGIAGFLQAQVTRPLVEGEMAKVALAMADAIAHRGPDAEGVWSDAPAGVALSHRRLSILDLSEAGAQPMASPSGRYVMVYNGEVYNAPAMAETLRGQGYAFCGHSDTEVMLAAFDSWGIAAALERFVGMFAFALWDRQERRLTLVRDRMGIKPLYFGCFGGTWLFGSQPKCFLPHPAFEPAIDAAALPGYFRFAYVTPPASMWAGVQALPPGHIAVIEVDGRMSMRAWWSLEDVAAEGQENRFDGSLEEATDVLAAVLGEAVEDRMLADVPLGAFLSGGIDSSTVVALMQARSDRPVKTFAIGFNEAGYDESAHAAAVAAHLGTEHHEERLTGADACSLIPDLPTWYDEPFADVSQLPTLLVSRLARRHVTVSLSGDGGDELFAGYDRYHVARKVWTRTHKLSRGLRKLGAGAITALPPHRLDQMAQLMPRGIRPVRFGTRAHKLAGVLGGDDPLAFYRSVVSQWTEPDTLTPGMVETVEPLWHADLDAAFPDIVERMQFLDAKTYLPHDILTKVDRASMAVSLEARVPIIDHRVVAFAWRLPPALKYGDATPKRVLRRLLYRHVPRELVERPKMGFGVPIGDWLRGPLRDWAEDLLSERALAETGLLAPPPIRTVWADHLTNRANADTKLWSVLMFQAWQRAWLGAAGRRHAA